MIQNSSQFDNCLLMNATKLISKKWIGFIFCQLFENEKMYFNELKKGINEKSTEQLSASALSQTLKILEENKIIEKQGEPHSHPPKIFYSLTEKGIELRLILALLKKWSTKWSDKEKTGQKCCVVEFLSELEIKLNDF